jgi:mortality factor 4-like protein 1
MKKRFVEDKDLKLEISGDGEVLKSSIRESSLVPNNSSRFTRSTGITRSARSKPIPSWANPKSRDFHKLRWLGSEHSIVDDNLTQLPSKNHTYIDLNGELKDPDKYDIQRKSEDPHPNLARHVWGGTETPALRLYYKDMRHDLNMPIAGEGSIGRKDSDEPEILDYLCPTPEVCDEREPPDSVIRDSVETSSSSSSSFGDLSEQVSFPGLARNPISNISIAPEVRSEQALQNSVVRDSVESSSSSLYSGDSFEQALYSGLAVSNIKIEQSERLTTNTNDEFQEEAFHAKPAIRIVIPDHIKAILVDDWENVTKNQQLVPLPAAQPVTSILKDYLEYEQPKREAGSAQADILVEVVAGLKEYFDKCLGRILLYRYALFSHI